MIVQDQKMILPEYGLRSQNNAHNGRFRQGAGRLPAISRPGYGVLYMSPKISGLMHIEYSTSSVVDQEYCLCYNERNGGEIQEYGFFS